MAYLKRQRIGRRTYFYILQSVRRGDKTSKRVLEYLGARPSRERLRKAIAYWGVKAKPKGGRAR